MSNNQRTNKFIEIIKTQLNEEIKDSRQELESLSGLSKTFNLFLSNFQTSLKFYEPPLKYKASSLFLKECFDFLTSTSHEVLHLVSGIELTPKTYFIDRLEKVKFQASAVYAEADTSDLMKRLFELDEQYGHLLLAVFHSHPFNGLSGTLASGVDKNLQQVLEEAGYHCVQAIFSRDGYIRFFSNKLNFEIEIYGKGIEKIQTGGKENEKIFRLTNLNKETN